jgi:hypothetical protein
MEGDNILPANKDRAINKLHKEILRDCIDHEIRLESSYNLEIDS